MRFIERVKAHYRYDREEIKHFIILSLLLGFFFSFNEWGEETFDLMTGLVNLGIGILIAAVGIFVHDAGHRLTALHTKHKFTSQIWWSGIGITGLICLASRGMFNLFFAESFEVEVLKRERVGTFFYRTKLSEIRDIAIMGAGFNLLFATLVKFIGGLGGITGGIVHKIILFNVIYGLVQLLPFPPLDGSKIIFERRWIYAIVIITAAVYGYLLLTAVPIWVSLILTLLLGVLAGFLVFGK